MSMGLSDLESTRHMKWGELHQNYETRTNTGQTVGANTYQIDTESLGRIATTLAELRSGKVNPHGGFWVDIVNAKVTVDDSEATTLLEALVAGRLAVDQHYLDTRDSINQATTESELDAIDVGFTGV